MKFNQAMVRMMQQFGMVLSESFDAEGVENAYKEFFGTLPAGSQAQVMAQIHVNDGTPGKIEARATALRNQQLSDLFAAAGHLEDVGAVANSGGREQFEAWKANLIQSGASVEFIRQELLSRSSVPAVTGFADGSINVGLDRGRNALHESLSDAMAQKLGARIAKPHAMAERYRHRSMLDIGRSYFEGCGVDCSKMANAQIARAMLHPRLLPTFGGAGGGAFATHSTSDFDNVLRDAVNKRLRTTFAEVPKTSRQWVNQVDAKDFKTVHRPALGGVPTPPIVYEGGEYTYCTIGDKEESYTLAKHGQMFSLTWEALVNDDLQAFDRMATAMMRAAGRIEDNLVYAILTGNPALAQDSVALFHTATHGNLASSGTALSVTSLAAALAAMALQTGINANEYLNLQGVFLIVPVGKKVLAQQLVSSTVDPAKNNSTINPFQSALTVIADPRLDASSTTQWYVATSPAMHDTIELCFLEGTGRQPEVLSEEGFDVDERTWKVRHSVAAAPLDWRGLYANPGA